MSIKDLLNYLDEQLEKHRTLVCTSCTSLGRWLHRSGIAGPRFMLSGCVFFLTSAGYYFFYKKQYNVAVFLCFMALSMLIMALTMDRGDNIEFIALAFAIFLIFAGAGASILCAMKLADTPEEREKQKQNLLAYCGIILGLFLVLAAIGGITYLIILFLK